MQVHYDTDNLPVFRNAIVTIGTFDGVHLGHRQIIENLQAEAKTVKGETVIITFHPHPRKVVASTILGIRLINTLDEKIELLRGLGIDHLVVVPFTDAFANQSAEGYISDFLVKKFRPHTVIIGYDHRFGKGRQGDYRMLEEKAKELGFVLKEIPKHLLDNISISSTNIREAILINDTITANSLLGYDYFFSGKVIHGDSLGRKLGYPTANLKISDDEKIIPGDGIYAVYIQTPEAPALKKGMMSIGFRPTVGGKHRVIEVHIIDYDSNLYEQSLKVIVKKYLRPELKFDTLEALTSQIDKDKEESLKVL